MPTLVPNIGNDGITCSCTKQLSSKATIINCRNNKSLPLEGFEALLSRQAKFQSHYHQGTAHVTALKIIITKNNIFHKLKRMVHPIKTMSNLLTTAVHVSVSGRVVNNSNSRSGGLGFKPHPSHCFLRQGSLLQFVSLHSGV